MAVFGHDVGALVLGIAGIVGEILHRGVHDGDDIGVGVELGPLVDHRPRGVVLLEQAVGLLEADAVAALVAQAPGNDRGVVAVATVHVVDAVQDGLLPLCLLGQRVLAIALGVTLHVGLVPEVDARRVAQVVPQLVVGIVRGAHGVDAKLFHQGYVLPHLGGGDAVAAVHRVLVSVHAAYLHRPPVEPQLAVADVDVAETYLLGDTLGFAAGAVIEHHREVVEIGGAVAPGYNTLDLPLWEDGKPVTFLAPMPRGYAVEQKVDITTLYLAVQVDHHIQTPRAPVDGVDIGLNLNVTDVGLRNRVEFHVACDATHAPHILALQIAAVAPPQHLHRHPVAPVAQEARNVPLGRSLRIFAIAHLVPVDIEVHGRLDGAEIHNRAPSLPPRRHGEVAGVDPRRVVVGRRIGRIAGEFILHIHIHRHPIALQLHVARHTDAVPPHGIQFGLRRVVIEAEGPRAVQTHTPRPFRHHAVVGQQLAHAVHLQVVPVRLPAKHTRQGPRKQYQE